MAHISHSHSHLLESLPHEEMGTGQHDLRSYAIRSCQSWSSVFESDEVKCGHQLEAHLRVGYSMLHVRGNRRQDLPVYAFMHCFKLADSLEFSSSQASNSNAGEGTLVSK